MAYNKKVGRYDDDEMTTKAAACPGGGMAITCFTRRIHKDKPKRTPA